MGHLQADPGWHQVRAETVASGLIVAQVINTFYAADPVFTPNNLRSVQTQELRVYDAMPGKLPALHDRFAKHTMQSTSSMVSKISPTGPMTSAQ